MSYQAFALLPPGTILTVPALATLLEEQFRPLANGESVPSVDVSAERVTLSWPDWSIRLLLADNPTVRAESQEIAAALATDRLDQAVIASCNRRIEVASDPDPDMDHFNDYIFVLEVLRAIPQAILLDPFTGTFLLE